MHFESQQNDFYMKLVGGHGGERIGQRSGFRREIHPAKLTALLQFFLCQEFGRPEWR